MRNDEKIDINLATEGTSENLSEEELAQQNYETALRYINIAEHMNKFEDQDKYYHRAIQYLKKAKPYKKVQPLLRELRNKKFGTRAAGKIELYKEACHIRDNAKTPSDYYSAQTIFSRIYHYEEKHPLIGLIQRFTLKQSNALIQKNRWNFVLNSLMKKLPS